MPKVTPKKGRMDGWSNVLTGLGFQSKDKRLNSVANWERMLEVDAEELYGSDDIAAKIVNEPVDEAFKAGFEFTGIDKEDGEDLRKQMEKAGLITQFIHAWYTARIFGGSGLLLVTDDMEDLEQPLAEDAQLEGVTVLNRFELYVQYTDLQKNIAKPDFLMPKRYMLMPRYSTADRTTGEYIHASRIIRFDGVWLPNRLRAKNGYWHDSVLNRLQGIIRDYSVSNQSASQVVQDFSVAVYKLKNLADLIMTTDGETALLNRMNVANMVRSMTRCMILDADGEDFQHQTRSVAGLKEILEKIEDRLVAGTKFPHTVLLGTSPNGGGLTEGGSHEMKNWNNYIMSQQEHIAKPRLLQLAKMFAMTTEYADSVEDLDIEFNPLVVLDDKDEANLRYQIAQSDQIYFNMGAVDADEIAQSRFGGDQYSMETELDQTLRKPGERMDPDAEPDPVAPVDPKTGLPAKPSAAPKLRIAKTDSKKKATPRTQRRKK